MLQSSQPEAWIKATRSGARAARGYHYQDTVGAWLSVQILSAQIDAHSLTPEGKDDLVLVGPAGDHLVQVKSKQPHVEPFSVAEIARLLFEGLTRADGYGAARVTVLLEHISDLIFSPEWGTAVFDLPATDVVRVEFERLVAEAGATPAEVEAAARKCGYGELGWRRAEREACRRLVELRDLDVPQVAEPVLNALRQAVADTTDANAPAHLTELSTLTRTDLDRIVTEVLRTTDSSHLAEAIEHGLCSPVDFQATTGEGHYYEGASTQPRHVGAGLVFQPEGVLDALFDRLSAKGTLILTGPSGVGKSARAWSLVKHVPFVAWYRIDRLRPGDAAVIARFTAAMRPSAQAPVGLVFDQLAAGASAEFEELRGRLAQVRHTYLLATVRNEDLVTVLSAHEVAIAAVELDAGTAQGIFASLQERGLAVRSSWREAFEQSDGLTLEFAHILTQGRRLTEVIDAQVNERLIDPGRANEVSILALVCQADTWGVQLPAVALQERLQLDDGAMRRSTARLAREHLIADPAEGRLRGLHPLRSKAIASAVHRNPPPTEANTRRSLLEIVDDPDVGAIALGALRDGHDPSRVVAALVPGLRGASARRIASALRGVRLADFGRVAASWCDAILEADVPPALADLTASLHMMRSEVDGLPFHPSIPRALNNLRDMADDLPTHRQVIQELGLHDSLDAVASIDNLPALTDLLAALGPRWTNEAHPAPVLTGVQDLLRDSALEDLAQCMATARWVSLGMSERLAVMAGGEGRILQRVAESDRFITEAEIRDEHEEAVATARLLHISDTLQPDPRRRVRDLAGLMLRLLPNCERADVRATTVGGHAMEWDGYRPWESGLLRQYAISTAEVAWNRTRGLVVQQVMRERLDDPGRSETIPALIAEAADFLARLTTAWSTSRDRAGEANALNKLRVDLAKRIDDLLPPTGQHRSARPGEELVQSTQNVGPPKAVGSDDMHTLLSGIVYNLPERLQQPGEWGGVAAFCHDTLTKALDVSADEVRALTADDMEPALDSIRSTLRDLHAVLAELAWGSWTPRDVARWATSGPYRSALARTATAARSTADRLAEDVAERIEAEGQARGLSVRVLRKDIAAPDATNWPPVEYAVGVSLDAIEGWASSLAQLEQVVDQSLPTGHAPTLMYPLVEGRAVGALAMVRITRSYPGADTFAAWKDRLSDVSPTVITDAVVKAHRALQEVSSLTKLDSVRPEVDYQCDVDGAMTAFREAVGVLLDSSDGEGVVKEVTEILFEIASRVEAESGEDAEIQPGSLAEQVAIGSLGIGEPPEWTTMNALVAVAVLCDINPRLARRLLDRHD